MINAICGAGFATLHEDIRLHFVFLCHSFILLSFYVSIFCFVYHLFVVFLPMVSNFFDLCIWVSLWYISPLFCRNLGYTSNFDSFLLLNFVPFISLVDFTESFICSLFGKIVSHLVHFVLVKCFLIWTEIIYPYYSFRLSRKRHSGMNR